MSITLKAVPATPGAKGFDTVAPLTESILEQAWADGCRFVVRYVHATSQGEIDMCVTATDKRGAFAVMMVTYANNWNGTDALNTAKGLGYPQGATLWLDVESVTVPSDDLIGKINSWAVAVRVFFDPGEYVGCQQLLTWQQLTRLAVDRYWESCSLVVDESGNPSRPATGWNMKQVSPGNLKLYGTLVDLDYILADSRGRVPMWAVAV